MSFNFPEFNKYPHRMMILLHFIRISMQLSILDATTEINVSMMALAPDVPSI